MLPMSLIVAPLGVPSADAVAARFGEALRRDLGTGISAVGQDVTVLTLPANTESSPTKDARTMARHAGARYVVEGDVRSSNNTNITNLRLVDSESGIQAWSGQYAFHEADGSVEASIAQRKLVGLVVRSVRTAETKRALSVPADRLNPAELVLRAEAAVNQTPMIANSLKARDQIDKVLASDPNNLIALKARMWLLNDFLDLDPTMGLDQIAREADGLASSIMQIDPASPETWFLRATSLRYLRRWNAAIEASDQAIRRDPYEPFYYTAKAYIMILLGRPTEGLQLTERALALNPNDAAMHLLQQCYAFMLLGQANSAIEACEKANGITDYWGTQVYLVALFANQGNMTRAAAAARALEKGAPGYTIARAKRYSEVPEYLDLAEKYWFSGLRKAGVPEK